MAQNVIGPNFSNEIAAAGLGGLPFSWGPDGLHDTSQLTAAQLASLEAVLAAHNPAKVPASQSYAAALAADRDPVGCGHGGRSREHPESDCRRQCHLRQPAAKSGAGPRRCGADG